MANTLLSTLRTAVYEPHARPLLLAFEAVINNRGQILKELEPEVQTAAYQIFERLTKQ